MITLGWVLLRVESSLTNGRCMPPGFFTLISGIWYIFDGVKQLSIHEQKLPGA